MNDKAAYWVEIADYDLETARAMLEKERFLYVAFMCHRVVEKMLKACYANVTDGIPPYIHNLRKLAELAGLYGVMSEEQKALIETLGPLNVEARYPPDKARLERILSAQSCRDLLTKTEEICRWIRQRLSNS